MSHPVFKFSTSLSLSNKNRYGTAYEQTWYSSQHKNIESKHGHVDKKNRKESFIQFSKDNMPQKSAPVYWLFLGPAARKQSRARAQLLSRLSFHVHFDPRMVSCNPSRTWPISQHCHRFTTLSSISRVIKMGCGGGARQSQYHNIVIEISESRGLFRKPWTAMLHTHDFVRVILVAGCTCSVLTPRLKGLWS